MNNSTETRLTGEENNIKMINATHEEKNIENRKRYMQMAIDLSEQSVDGKKGGPFGAVIVKNEKIVGASGNCEFSLMDPCEGKSRVSI